MRQFSEKTQFPGLRIFGSISIAQTFLFTLLSLITLGMATDYKNGDYSNYDYYGDYDNFDDGPTYTDLEPALYDYYEAEQKDQRPKKELRAASDLNWMKGSLAEPNPEDCASTTTPGAPPAETTTECDPANMTTTTECDPVQSTTTCAPDMPSSNFLNVNHSGLPSLPTAMPTAFRASTTNEQEEKAKELRQLVQHLYIAQARVQLEASEIKKAQAIANEAQQQLEESANHVRAVTAALQNAQQEVASSAIRAQTAQLQLAAHDQLLFAARQDVDALSSQMVGLQAAEGIAQPKATFDITALMEKLRQPLMDTDKPTPVPTIAQNNVHAKNQMPTDFYYDDEYVDY